MAPRWEKFKSYMATPEGGMTGVAAFQSVLGAWTAWSQGSAARRVAESNARIAESNRRIADMQAEDALRRGHEAESRYRGRTKKTIGRQRAALAAQGIRVDEGSALDVQIEAADFGELDAMTIRNNALRESFGYKMEGYGFESRGREALLRGEQARAQGIFEGTQSLLTGGIRALGYYKEWDDERRRKY